MKKHFSIILCLGTLLLTGCESSGVHETPTEQAKAENTTVPTPAEAANVTHYLDAEYLPVTVDGITRIDTELGKGIELDLNGDGTAEQIFIGDEGIYINGELAADLWRPKSGAQSQGWDFYWITDIDTSDQYYNLIFNSGDDASKSQIIAWYDGSLHVEKLSNFNGDAFSTAEYHRDGTFIVASYPVPLPYQSCYRPVEFRWSAETGLERIPNEVELDESCTWTLLAGLNLYQSADFESETVTIGAQEIFEGFSTAG